MKIINTSKADIFLSYKPEEQAATKRIARAIDGSLVEIEEQFSFKKAPAKTLVVPGATRMGAGEVTITKTEYAKLDEECLKRFEGILHVSP